MLKKRIEDALNKQINAELFSAYLYLSMSAYFESINLKGAANWMRVQAQEEMVHANKFYNYVIERGGRVQLFSIDAPKTTWNSVLNAFEDAYEHELKVTNLINDLVSLANEEKDYATNSFLLWFVNEQVEEEASVDAVIQRLKLAGENAGGLFMIDNELGQRVFVQPTNATE